jgi:predicted RNA-binding protein with PUA-like domain
VADILTTLNTLVNKDDARHWAAVNNYEAIEQDDTMIIGDYVLTFNLDGRLSFVERRVPEGNAL